MTAMANNTQAPVLSTDTSNTVEDNETSIICRMDTSSASNTSSATQSGEVKAFPFMKLPGELRNMIYKLCLKKHQIVKFGKKVSDVGDSSKSDSDVFTPNLLRVNHQIYNEAHAILYGANTFDFKQGSVFPEFFAMIGREVAGLRKIRLRHEDYLTTERKYGTVPFAEACKRLHEAPNLEELIIYCKHYSREKTEDLANYLFKNLRGWFCVMVERKSSVEGAVEAVQLDASYSAAQNEDFHEKLLPLFKTLDWLTVDPRLALDRDWFIRRWLDGLS